METSVWKISFFVVVVVVLINSPIPIDFAALVRTTGPNWLGSPLSTMRALIFPIELHKAIGSSVNDSVALSHSSMNRCVKWLASNRAWSRRPETVNVDTMMRYLYSSDRHGMLRSSKLEFSKRLSLLHVFRTEAANLMKLTRRVVSEGNDSNGSSSLTVWWCCIADSLESKPPDAQLFHHTLHSTGHRLEFYSLGCVATIGRHFPRWQPFCRFL